MEVSDPYLQRLVELCPPPHTRFHTGQFMGFDSVERDLGIKLPPAYKELVSTYGHGVWFESLHVVTPFLAMFHDLKPWYVPQMGCSCLERCDQLRAVRKDYPDWFSYPIYPEPGGIFPWAFYFGIAGTLYWVTDGPPANWKTLCEIEASPGDWEVVEGSPTKLLWQLATADKGIAGTGLDASIAGFRSELFRATKWAY